MSWVEPLWGHKCASETKTGLTTFYALKNIVRMTREQLKSTLSNLGISQVDLARLLGVTPRAVSLWLSGTRSIPGPVTAYLELFVSLPRGAQQAELAKRTETTTMKNGMYLIEYAGADGHGYAALVFEDGRIFGADVAAARYDGSYEFNERTGLIDVQIRVEMPANVRSVVGVAQPFDWILEVTTAMPADQDVGRLQVKTNLGSPIVADYRFLRSLPQAA